MRKNKILSTVISAIMALLIITNAVGAETVNIDTLYKNAYEATQDSLRAYSQKYVNIARGEIKKLPANMNWAIGEFSKQVDTVQHYILSKIVITIKMTEKNLIQANINMARSSIPEELNTYWRNSYSSAIDKLQQKLQSNALEALKKAEAEKTEENIKIATELVSELMSSDRQAIRNWAEPLCNRVESLGGTIGQAKPGDIPAFPPQPEYIPVEKPKPVPPSGVSLKPREIEKYLGNFNLHLYSTVFGDPKHGANYRLDSNNFEVRISDWYLSINIFKINSQDVGNIKSVLKMALPTSYEEVYNLSRKASSDGFIYRDGRKIEIYKGNIVVDYNPYN